MDNPFQEIFSKLNNIEKMLLELKAKDTIDPIFIEDDILNLTQASELIHLAKDTIYHLTSTSKIPVIKKGKRLYFSKRELIEWLKSGRRSTLDEIEIVAKEYVERRKAIRR